MVDRDSPDDDPQWLLWTKTEKKTEGRKSKVVCKGRECAHCFNVRRSNMLGDKEKMMDLDTLLEKRKECPKVTLNSELNISLCPPPFRM